MSLSERAGSIREAMVLLGHAADAADLKQREVAHAAELQRAIVRLRKANETLEVLISAGAREEVVRTTDRTEIDEFDRLLHDARTGIDDDPHAYLLSGLPGNLSLALVRVEREIASDALSAWQTFARNRASHARLDLGEVLGSALGGIPRFEKRVERLKTSATEVRTFLNQSDLPDKGDVQRFEKAVAGVERVVTETRSCGP